MPASSSAGTVHAFTVIEPTLRMRGSIVIVYVPLASASERSVSRLPVQLWILVVDRVNVTAGHRAVGRAARLDHDLAAGRAGERHGGVLASRR